MTRTSRVLKRLSHRPPTKVAGSRHDLTVSPLKGYTHKYVGLLTKASNSKQFSDPFAQRTSPSDRGVIDPVYPFGRLCQLPLENNILRQCIDAYVINIESYGHTLEYIGKEGEEDGQEVQSEKSRLNAFLDYPSPENSMRTIRERSRYDKETIGNNFFEVSRNVRGEVIMLDHIPASTMRLTKKDAEPTLVEVSVRDPKGNGYILHTVSKFLRRYVQKTATNRKVYFKEFGDPRSIDPVTGDVDDSLSVEDQATEVVHRYLYTPGMVYGAPRWIGQLPAIIGSRESELVNLNFFRENAIPAMAVLVSGGALTEDSFNRVEQYITAARGRDAMHRVMVLEASADDASGSIEGSPPVPKIDMKPMLSERQQDGLFQGYDQNNMQKVRSSFRLPPIYVGRAEDYTRASSITSILVAESQIFSPERSSTDDFMNRDILSTYRPKFWRYKSLGPPSSEPEGITKLLEGFGGQGALTPNAVIKIANKMLDIHIDPIMEKWGDVPFDIVMEAAKSGRDIIGLADFADSLPNIPPLKEGPKTTPKKLASNMIKRELRAVKNDLTELLQTSAPA